MKENKQILKGSLAALVVNIIFGFSFLFSKVALSYASPLIILAARFTIAFLVMNILWICGFVKMSFKGKPKKQIMLMALAQPLLYFIFELYGIDSTSSAMSGIVISLVPVVVIILSAVFLKEKATKPQIFFSAVSLVSIVVMSVLSDNGVKSKVWGIILLSGATICAAVFNILSRSSAKDYSPFERTYIMFLVGAISFTTISLAAHRGDFATEIINASENIEFWGAILYLSVVSSIIAFMLYNYSTGLISPVRSASFSNLITVVSVVAGILILHEPMMSTPEIICCVLIILGVMGVNK